MYRYPHAHIFRNMSLPRPLLNNDMLVLVQGILWKDKLCVYVHYYHASAQGRLIFMHTEEKDQKHWENGSKEEE